MSEFLTFFMGVVSGSFATMAFAVWADNNDWFT